MRRPLKPFVTEYKQSSRRSSPPVAEHRAFEPDRPAARPVDLVSFESDDSYEAAMRAADALFSSPSPVPARHNGAEETPPAVLAPGADTPNSEKNGGRILRVIDEAPSPQLAALEADRAPKRRGRKPGSKNKPKAALVSGPIETQPAFVRQRAAATITPATPPSVVPVAQVEALVASRSSKRATWGRDRLRPGEDWKRRRLPRVCW